MTTERGLDAADFSMFAYGGAGPLHATMVARELQIDRVIIPNSPGHFSAFGMLMSDFRHDEVRSWFRQLKAIQFEDMEAIFVEMEQAGRTAIEASGVSMSGLAISRAADMRYVGQEHAVTAELPADRETAARWSVAVMELGALVCTARAPRCGSCPVADRCAWRLAGFPADDGPPRRAQTWAGTDRQCRGRLLAVLRESEGPVHRSRLEAAWADPQQRERCLASLVEDGLLVQPAPTAYALP